MVRQRRPESHGPVLIAEKDGDGFSAARTGSTGFTVATEGAVGRGGRGGRAEIIPDVGRCRRADPEDCSPAGW